jgi:uncharacterized protein
MPSARGQPALKASPWHLDEGEELIVDDRTVAGAYSFGIIPERGGTTAGWGDAEIEVARRGGHDIVRPRHPPQPAAHVLPGHAGPPTEPAPGGDRPVRPFRRAPTTTVGAAVDGLERIYTAPGRVEFDVDGQPLALTAFPGHQAQQLTVLFTDATAGTTTYGLVRGLAVQSPASDGTVTLDFNRATNLSCAYADLATWPLPPRENRLPVPIEAGEKTPYERLEGRLA